MVSNLFEGRSAVITGAAAGIGLALAAALLERGAKVLLADIDSESLADAEVSLELYGERVEQAFVDVTDASAMARLVDTAVARFGQIDYFFNNAGIGGALPIHKATLAHWERIIGVNLWGVIHGVDAVLPQMRRQGSGHIVNISSISGLIPYPGQSLYVTTKHAVVGLSESLRHELADEGIAVSVVCPGPVESDIWNKPIIGGRIDGKAPPGAMTAEAAAQEILASLGRKPGIIVLPALARRDWRLFRWFPRLADKALLHFGRLQREMRKAG